MKNLFLFALLIGTITLLSCNSAKKTVEPATTSVNQETETRQAPPQRSGRRGEGQRGQFQEQLISKLNLSAEQTTQFKSITEKYRNEMQAMRQNSDGDRSTIRASMENLMSKQNAEVKEILTESQFELYTKLIEERRKNRKKGPRGPR